MEHYIHQPKRLSEVTRDLAAVAMGNLAADLIIRNGKLVNVNIGAIQNDMDVVVKHGWIVYVGKDTESKLRQTRIPASSKQMVGIWFPV